MRARDRLAIAILVALAAACGAQNPDPREPTLADVQRSGLGAWVQVATIHGAFVEGELISVDAGMIRVLPPGANAVVSLSKPEIASGKLYRYTSDSGFGAWGALGTISTLSHGFWLVFSVPIWAIWTGATGAAENNHVVLQMKPGDESWAQVARWARFPQGMPRGFAQPPPGVTEPAPSESR
jgi:hypothetical protein